MPCLHTTHLASLAFPEVQPVASHSLSRVTMGILFSSSSKKTKTVVRTTTPESIADARKRLKLNPNRVNWGVRARRVVACV